MYLSFFLSALVSGCRGCGWGVLGGSLFGRSRFVGTASRAACESDVRVARLFVRLVAVDVITLVLSVLQALLLRSTAQVGNCRNTT